MPIDRDDPCWFFFTSGTTGRPKASVLTHGQMAFVVTNHLCDLMPGLTSADASLVVAPLSHGAGVHQLAQVARGVKTVLMPTEKLDIPVAWELIERWRISTMFTVPTILKLLVEHESAGRFDHSSLRYVIYAGAPMYREDQKRALARARPGARPVLRPRRGDGRDHRAADPAPRRRGRPGGQARHLRLRPDRHAAPGRRARTGARSRPFETGEICAIGPAVFAGYYDNPEANAKAFRDGWFRTGDLGHTDEQGFLYITGRASDMYISGGSNVYPREIEEKILTHPAVTEVAVVGVPDPLWGEVGIAVCVATAEVSEAELAAFLDGKLSRYKLPKRFVFWEALPKSAYGKVTKKLVREELDRLGLGAPERESA